MGKKITSLFAAAVIAVAAIPAFANAQFEKAVKQATPAVLTHQTKGVGLHKMLNNTERQAIMAKMQKANPAANAVGIALRKVEADNASFNKLLDRNFRDIKKTAEASRVASFACLRNDVQNNNGAKLVAKTASTDPVVVPEGLETAVWYTKGYQVSSNGETKFNGNVTVGFDGNDVYMQGLFTSFPEAWIKGVVDGNTVTFPQFQFIGTFSSYDIWAVGAVISEDGQTADLSDIVMTFDAENGFMTAETEILANAAEDRVYYLEWLSGVVCSANEFPEETAVTGAPIDVLPYENSLGTLEQFGQFGILDANDDGTSWKFNTTYESAAYSYSATNAANDWLISPAILLEAGENYSFAIDATNSGSYPERMEVKMAAEAKASVLAEGATLIEPTELADATFQTFEQTFTVAETGYYHFGIHAISDADQFRLLVKNFVVAVAIKPEAPAAATGLTVEPYEDELGATVSFFAPATTFAGEALTEITNTELYRDGAVIANLDNVQPGQEIVYFDEDPNLTVGPHTYRVICYNSYGAGPKSEEVAVTFTTVFNAPYFADIFDESAAFAFSAIDANEDGKSWSWDPSYGFYYSYNSYNDADDYLVTSRINLEAGKTYTFKISARGGAAAYPERFEVVMGSEASVEGLQTVVIPATEVITDSSDPDVTAEGTVTVEADGKYYFAVHAISDADMYRLYVNSISILNPEAPESPVLSMVPAEEGKLWATINVTAPSKSLDGNALEAGSLGEMTVVRDGEVVKTFEAVEIGKAYEFVDNVEENGIYNYQAMIYAANGQLIGKSDIASAYVGIDTPLDVEDLTGEDLLADGSKFTWSPVGTVGAYNGYVNPAEVTYNVWNTELDPFYAMFGYEVWIPSEVIGSTAETNYIVNEPTNEGEQEVVYYAVTAANNVGESAGVLIDVLKGAPYALPFAESVANGGVSYNWAIDYDSEDVTISLAQGESSDDDNYCFSIGSAVAGQTGMLISYKVAPTAANPVLTFDYNAASSSTVSVYVMTPDGTVNEIDNAKAGNANKWQTAVYSLAEYAAQPYIRFIIASTIGADGETTLIDNINVYDQLDYDLRVERITAPKSVTNGDDIEVEYVVKNWGSKKAENVVVNLSYTDKETEPVLVKSDTIKSFVSMAKRTYKYEQPTSAFTGEQSNFQVDIVFEQNLNDEDNTAGVQVAVKQSQLPQPQAVVLETANLTNASSATISWSAPDVSDLATKAAATVTETFEDCASWSANNFNGFTTVDADGATTGGIFSDASYIGQGTAFAYEIFDNTDFGGYDVSNNFPAHSGNKFAFSIYSILNNDFADNDDWLISPALSGAAQTISFWANNADGDGYGTETIQILASKTNTDLSSFSVVNEATISGGNWQEITAQLPSGTKYFAIRNVSDAANAFILMIDDITYQPGNGGGSVDVTLKPVLTGYNIYVDHAFTVNAKASETESTFPHRFNGTEKIYVTAVYDLIDEAQPNRAEKRESAPVQAIGDPTGIEELIANGENVNIYTMDGKLIRSNAGNANGLRKGVYVVGGKKAVIK